MPGVSYVGVLVSIGIAFWFAASAILVIVQKRTSRIAWALTAFGFATIVLGLIFYGFIAYLTSFTENTSGIKEPKYGEILCGMNPIINESHLWYMFRQGSLAHECLGEPGRFHMELSECYKFIPPTNSAD